MTSYLPMDGSVYPGVQWIISVRSLFLPSISFSPKSFALQLHSSQISVPKIYLNISEVVAPVPFSLRGYLHGRLDGMFVVEAGRDFCRVGTPFIPCLHENAFTQDHFIGTISSRTIWKVSVISFRQSGTGVWYDKNCPALARIPVEPTGFRLFRKGRKTSWQTYFHLNGMGQISDIYIHARARLSSRPPSHVNSP